MTGLVVGVDLGSSSARAVAIDRDGRVVAEATAPYPTDADPALAAVPGRADPRVWRRGLATALEMLQTKAGGAARPDAVCLGGQSPTTVPADGGMAVTCRHPAGATEAPADQHQRQFELLRTELGSDIRPMQLWDWLAWKLGAPPRQARWPGDRDMAGYGPVVLTGEVVGIADGTDTLPAGTPLVAGAQDAYLAFWAAGTDVPGRALDPGGRTGGLGVAVLRGKVPHGMFTLASAATGVDIVGGPVSGHGLMLEWLAGVTGRRVEELLSLAATVPPGARGVTALPYLEGERAPRWSRELRAELVGIGFDTGAGELARAVLEGAAYGLAHIARDLANQGVAADVLVCGGAPARSRLWCSIKASVLEIPVEIPAYTDLAAYGAALSAGAGACWWPKPGLGSSGAWPRPPVERIAAQPHQAYRDGYPRFVALGDRAVSLLSDSPEDRCPTR